MNLDTKNNLDTVRKKIAKFTFCLKKQSEVPLWSIADESLIYSAALNIKYIWSNKKGKLHWLIRLLFLFSDVAVDVLIFLFGMSTALGIWLPLKKKKGASKNQVYVESVFAGFGATGEKSILAEYAKKHEKPFLYVNWVTHENEEKIGCPSLFKIIKTITRNAFGYTKKLKKLDYVKSYRTDFLTVCAINIGEYAFYEEFWKIAKLNHVCEVTFLTPSISLFACVEMDINTTFLQHGLLALAVLIPKVDCIVAITDYEKKYFETICDDLIITKKQKKFPIVIERKKNILVLSPDFHMNETKIILENFIAWAKKNDFSIILRPRPSISKNDLDLLLNYYSSAYIDDFQSSLEDSIIRFSPMFVVSGSSTGLATALDYGLLPVSLCDPEMDDSFWPSTSNKWKKTIYPMYKHVLFWPSDYVIISKVIGSNDMYNEQLARLNASLDINLISTN